MDKTQKIWLAVFSAMFLIPEIINPEISLVLFYWIRELFFGISLSLNDSLSFNIFGLQISQNLKEILLFIKLIGLVSAFVFLLKIKNGLFKFFFIFFVSILLLSGIFYLLSYFSFSNLP